MAFFNSLQLIQFRNYSLHNFAFNERIVAISGLNGSGKTNLLDAIYYLCFTKSFFSRPDLLNVQKGTQGFRIHGHVDGRDVSTITAILRENGKKEFFKNDVLYKKLSEHIGTISCVMIAPDDISIIMEGSEYRRKFVDGILSQLDSKYLEELIKYNKILQQRNSLLKQNLEFGNINSNDSLLSVYDEQLIKSGNYIFQQRKYFLEKFIPIVEEQYIQIAAQNDALSLSYNSKLIYSDYALLLRDGRRIDLLSGRSNYGIHKDDIELKMGDALFKTIASQGQRKSLLFALKLAEFVILKEAKQQAPILLLDDVFEKLDQQRMLNLLQFVCQEQDGQVFITDTHRERLQATFSNLGQSYQEVVL